MTGNGLWSLSPVKVNNLMAAGSITLRGPSMSAAIAPDNKRDRLSESVIGSPKAI
ncbi:MAG: hypothetical protein AAF827_03760 [Cyanobacteria bacterium P01_D01_bin.6]